MYGPNTNTSGGSIIFYLEAQAAYIRQALVHLRDSGASSLDVRPEVEARHDGRRRPGSPAPPGLDCNSWYQDRDGRIVANWPGYQGGVPPPHTDLRTRRVRVGAGGRGWRGR